MTTRRTPFGLILLLWAAGLGAAAQFAKVSLLLPELGLAYPEAGLGLGLLVSFLSMLGAVLGLVAGVMVARFGARRLLLPALWGGAALSLIQSVMPTFELFLFLRVLEGASHLLIVVAAPTLIAQLSEDRHLGFCMTLWSTFFAVSFAITARFGLPLVAEHGAPLLYQIHGGFMAAVALWLGWRLPRSGAVEGRFLGISELIERHVTVYKSPREVAPALGWLCYTMTFVALMSVLPARMPEGTRDWVAQAMPLAGLVVSMTLGVWMLRFWSAVRLIQIGFALGIACALGFVIWPDAPLVTVLLCAAMGFVQGGSFAAVVQLNPEREARARANGAMAQMGNLGNLVGTPILLAMVAGFGVAGIIGFTIVSFAAGIFVHVWSAQRRRAEEL